MQTFRLTAIACLMVLMAAPVFADKETAQYRKIENLLDATVLADVTYEELDIKDVLKDIAKRANVSIVTDKKALAALDEDDRKITLDLANIKAGNVLNIVLGDVGLKKTYQYSVLYITSKERAKKKTSTKTYDVRDITVKIKDFAGPRLRLKSESDDGPPIEYPDDDDDIETDDIVELIEDTIDADWGGDASVSIINKQLVIRATRETHKEVKALLGQLRASK